MSLLGGFLNFFAVPPSIFPLLVQLDNCQRLKAASTLPLLRWPIFVAANILMGIYFSLAANSLIMLPIEYHLSALLGLGCWGQQLQYSQPTNSPYSLTNFLISRCLAAGLIESAIYGALYLFNSRILLICLGISGACLFAASLISLPYDRNFDLDSPDGGWQPLSLSVQAASFFITLIVLFLFYRNVDFFGCGIVASQIVSILGVIGVHQLMRKSKVPANRSYTSIPLQNM